MTRKRNDEDKLGQLKKTLNKCKICGHTPIIFKIRRDEGVTYDVACINPDCGKKSEEDLLKEAMYKWNKENN